MKFFNKGFNLIELLVATAISVSLVSVAAGLLARSIQSHRLQQGLAELNESTQFIAEFIRHEFYLAGFSGNQPAIDPVDWSHSKDGDKYDVVAVRRIASVNDYDCSGAALTPGQQYVALFYAQRDGDIFSLLCDRIIDGDPKNSVSLVDGVKRFQVLYGMEKKVGRSVNYVFMSSDDVKNIAEVDRHVVSVKIGILLSDTGPAVFSRKTDSWRVLDKIYLYDATKSTNAELNDGHFQRVVEWDIPLKNVSKEIKIASR